MYDPSGKYFLTQDEDASSSYIKCDAVDNKTKICYTARLVHRKSVQSTHLFEHLRNECEILGSISYNYIQEFIETLISSQNMIQIVESEKINLLQYYCNDFPLIEKVAAVIFADLMQAVNFLHSNNIVHLDIRPENVFVINGKFKLGGFFKAQFANPDENITSDYGSLNYQSPEIYEKMDLNSVEPSIDGRKADMWACGIFLYSILLGKLPFYFKPVKNSKPDCSDAFLFFKKLVPEEKIKIPHYLSESVRQLLKTLLKRNPSERPSCNTVINCEWLKQLQIKPNEILPRPFNES